MSDEREMTFYLLKVLLYPQDQNFSNDECDEMIGYMKRIIDLNPELSNEERTYLSNIYKIAVSNRRNYVRDIEQNWKIEQEHQRLERAAKIREFLDTLYSELTEVCMDLISLIDSKLLPMATTPESRVFYMKLKGDYYRYILENENCAGRQSILEGAQKSYEDALEISRSDLQPTAPLVLGLILNYSVFQYEILHLENEAIELAQRTFSETVDLIENMSEEAYSETSVILHLIRDNHANWVHKRDGGV